MTPPQSPPGAPAPHQRPRVRAVELDAGGVTLSGLLAVPQEGMPRAVLVALHGAGMRAGYFHGRADAATSLLSLAASCGCVALALDRPGYGGSAARLPEGLGLAGQADHVREALAAYGQQHPTGGGYFLVGHSLGGKVALATAADWEGADLLGVDVSGVSDRWAVPPERLTGDAVRRARNLHWGPISLYPPRTFQLAEDLVAPIPAREAAEIPDWPRVYPRVAERVRVPTRLTFAEHERWWRSDARTVRAMAERLAAPLVRTERVAAAGHNISLGLAARGYHLRVLAFLEECLARADAAVA
ncbi:Thioesterase domain-containing protein [Streptomyces zhaozhouensis]|uniref:Thioesterase domain-containing protein n=1 Tax=Streptomyces zhaozhouensis TaxID=1300267 RepID=A0A286E3T8_9ACTN|nr:alpha/beta hydrolase family protein [Streptomyces zhaozhouensis]SOD65575.1 Thioesterase domain-containing protein [Streptomyces zhaozhouensis]